MVNMNKLKRPAIYALHAGDFRMAYVGTTSKNSKNRLWEHIYRARNGHPSPVYEWMREVGIENVEVVDLEAVIETEDAIEREAHWIARLIGQGHPIVNRKGRDGVANSMADESKAIIGEKARGRVTWIAGLTGEAAGWTEERRRAQADRVRARNAG